MHTIRNARMEGELEGLRKGKLEGLREGELKGLREGELKGLREACLNLAEFRFGKLDASREKLIFSRSPDELRSLQIRMFEAREWDDLFE